MISSIQSNAGWLPANHAPQVNASEGAGERENDGDSDDTVGAVKTAFSAPLSQYMGQKVDTLA